MVHNVMYSIGGNVTIYDECSHDNTDFYFYYDMMDVDICLILCIFVVQIDFLWVFYINILGFKIPQSWISFSSFNVAAELLQR